MLKKSAPPTHRLRTFLAAIAGIIAVYLVLASITVVWLNRTITDNTTYVGTVAPLVSKPAVQTFIAQKVTDQLINSAPDTSLASSLLPASDFANNPSPTQVQALLEPVIKANILKIVSSPSFAALWKSTNQTAQAGLISELNSTSGVITLNFSPAITGVITQLGTTQLAPLASHITISPTAGIVTIKSNKISQIHHYYRLFQTGTVVIVIVALLAAALSIWLSVHHAKTLRRILIGVGVLALLQAVILAAPTVVTTTKIDVTTLAAAKAVIEGLFHNLQLASLIVGLVCIAAAIGSKVYSKQHQTH
jgi:hypothetical protein